MERVHQNVQACDDRIGTFQEESVIGGDVGLALCAVDNDRVSLADRALDLCIGGEGCAAETADACIFNDLHDLLRRRFLKRLAKGLDRLVKGVELVVFNDNVANGDALCIVTGGDLLDCSRNTCVNGTTETCLDNADDLSDLYRVSNVDNGRCMRTNVLGERNRDEVGLGQANCFQAFGIFVLVEVCTSAKGKFHNGTNRPFQMKIICYYNYSILIR